MRLDSESQHFVVCRTVFCDLIREVRQLSTRLDGKKKTRPPREDEQSKKEGVLLLRKGSDKFSG